MKTGTEIITEERKRQIEKEGYSHKHDDNHINGEISLAAVSYAIPPKYRKLRNSLFPWDVFKPTPADRIKELAKAGALIAAEIDRLNRTK